MSPKIMTMVSLGGYQSPSGGYMNYGEFHVSGYILNEKTRRKNRFKQAISAKAEDEAQEKAKQFGFVDDEMNIEAIPFEKATERQILYASDLGALLPEDLSKWDVHAIIDRFVGDFHHSNDGSPEESPSEEFADFADKIGVRFSKFVGKYELLDSVIAHLTGRDKAAFYAYAILKAHNGIDIETDTVAPDLTGFYDFADSIVASEDIMRSIKNCTLIDYKHPHKGAKAYKAVAEYFKI